ncbi:homoisocitrate dehydrogenase [Halopseudomonas xinjiangensis]|uniref:Homoisocitrate dehydrogenase n=1 Tax=Halopseudomonas xinjiangensis TaxID=487184 RepID=A0A1H1W122_9GAMM|nr:homoisocitrate dehydrogenase [Halopseudomonas xinjiangensis]
MAAAVLEKLLPDLEVVEAEAGWDCFTRHGSAVPERTLESLLECGAGLFGAVSSPAGRVEGYRSAILTLRQKAGLYVNVRPVRSWPQVSPRPDVDLVVVRENSEGLYVGIERLDATGIAIAECHVSRAASERLAAKARAIAELRQSRRITIVHKANVLPLTGGLFRDSVRDVLINSGFGALVDERLVDVAALDLVAGPERFDVIVTSNLFGDILSDLASHWCGGLGMAPSLNWGDGVALAEPVHGSAPDIAGTGQANPIAAILSVALLLRYHWRKPELAERVERAVEAVLSELPLDGLGSRTTTELERAILEHL